MALPLLARGMGLILSGDAITKGRVLGVALKQIGDELSGDEDEHRTSVTVPVSSSAISSIGYHVGDIITVTFIRGGTYEYMGDEEIFMAFLEAPSKGRFFNEHFR